MEQTETWSDRFTKAVGRRVALIRERSQDDDGRKLTAKAVADRTRDLGHPIDRSVVAKLEKGHRLTITVPDLLVLAQALRVPPMHLLLPFTESAQAEILPGREASTVDVVRWIRGDAPLPESLWDGRLDGDSTIAAFLVHQQCVERWTTARHYARVIRAGEFEGDAEEEDKKADKAWQELRETRRLMRIRGLVPPRLAGPVALVDEEPAS